MTWRLEAAWGSVGDVDPEQIYGTSEPPSFASRDEAVAARKALLPGARRVAPGVVLLIIDEADEEEHP